VSKKCIFTPYVLNYQIMPIPEHFHNRVVESVLDQKVWLDYERRLVTDSTRAGIVALVDRHGGNMEPVLGELLRIEERLGHFLKIVDPEGDVRSRVFDNDAFKKLLRDDSDPAKVFAALKKQVPESMMAIITAQVLGISHREILLHAINETAEQQGCAEDIQALIAELRPRIQAEIEEEMKMSISERITKKGY
jgi:hypothetical protein